MKNIKEIVSNFLWNNFYDMADDLEEYDNLEKYFIEEIEKLSVLLSDYSTEELAKALYELHLVQEISIEDITSEDIKNHISKGRKENESNISGM